MSSYEEWCREQKRSEEGAGGSGEGGARGGQGDSPAHTPRRVLAKLNSLKVGAFKSVSLQEVMDWVYYVYFYCNASFRLGVKLNLREYFSCPLERLLKKNTLSVWQFWAFVLGFASIKEIYFLIPNIYMGALFIAVSSAYCGGKGIHIYFTFYPIF